MLIRDWLECIVCILISPPLSVFIEVFISFLYCNRLVELWSGLLMTEASRPAVSHHRLHMCHLQESTRRWKKVLSLGRVFLATISCLTGEWQSAGEHQRHCSLQRSSPIRWQKSLQQTATEMLDRANGLLSVGGLWEEPESIKITSSQALELL